MKFKEVWRDVKGYEGFYNLEEVVDHDVLMQKVLERNGKTQRPAKITAIEKGIVGIMLVDETSSFVKIGTILGLDVVNDKAEQSLLRTAIESLKSFNAIEGDDSCMALTDSGRAYADKGEIGRASCRERV